MTGAGFFSHIKPRSDLLMKPSLDKALPRFAVGLVVLLLIAFMVRTYAHVYRPEDGWTRLILFGAYFGPRSLPELQNTPHYVDPAPASRFGYDGQFYAQVALDPALEKPELPAALDNPEYRARRIGFPAFAYFLGLGNPWWILQAYAAGNLLFWLLLLGVLLALMRPWTPRNLLCLCAAALGFGVFESMREALTDVPAASLLFGGVLLGSMSGAAVLGAAALTRETSVLAVLGTLEFDGPPGRLLRRNAARLALAIVPCALWLVYVRHRFHHGMAEGGGNFAVPLSAFFGRVAEAWRQMAAEPGNISWRHLLYDNYRSHELLNLLSLFAQGVYLVARPAPRSTFWRIGVLYLVLFVCLGPAVWEGTGAAARVLLPMTISFYLCLAREPRPWLFWSFFLLSALTIPYGVHQFWMLR